MKHSRIDMFEQRVDEAMDHPVVMAALVFVAYVVIAVVVGLMIRGIL